MKTIKKLKDNIGKVAGSALLVGATLTAGAAAVSAQDNGSSGDLGDYPAPFVNEDGEVDTTVVVGETAEDGNPVSTADVVSAVEIAGSLGAAAFTEEEVNVDVETSGATAGTWAAENGVTLNRQNSQLYLGDATDSEENKLDDADLDILGTTTFQSEDSEEVEVDHEVNIGNQVQDFNADVGDLDDPVLHVKNPTNPESGGNLFSATAEFSDSLDFTAAPDSFDSLSGDEAPEDGETIEMFGQDFEFSDESDSNELVFYGSSQSFSIGTNEEAETVTVDGEDHEFDVSYVPSAEDEDATVTVDGDTQGAAVGDTIDVDGTEVRVTDFYKRSGDEGLGSVEFSIGSDEVVLDDSGEVEVGGDTLDAVSTDLSGADFSDLDEITFYFGAEDSDVNYVESGEMYEDPLFGLQFHYGGLVGNVAEDPASVLEVGAEEEGDATFTSTSHGEEADIVFRSDNENDNNAALAADEGDYISSFEGEHLDEDDYTVLNANEEAGLYEVTDIDSTDLEDADGSTGGEDETVGVTLRNVHTGDTVEVEEDGLDFSGTDSDGDSGESTDDDRVDATGDDSEYDDYTLDGESIEGKDFDITWNSDGTVSFDATSESNVAVYPHFYTAADGAAAFTETVDLTNSQIGLATGNTVDLRMPSTVSSNDVELTAQINDGSPGDSVGVSFDGTTLDVDVVTGNNTGASGVVTVGQTEYYVDAAVSDNSVDSVEITPNNQDGGTSAVDPSVLYLQPEDDEDEEHGYVLTPQYDTSPDDNELSGDVEYAYTGSESTGETDSYLTDSLDGEEVEVGYNAYGTYTEWDEESDDESFLLHVPSGQTPAGMAVTGAEGSLSADGGSSTSSGSAMSESATGSYADVGLDNELEGSDRTASNLILVGGPSVNSLVGELVDDNQTMPASDYTEGEGMVQMVDGFGDHSALIVAGHSGEDTRAAGEFLADYRNNQEDLEGSQVTVSTETGQVVE